MHSRHYLIFSRLEYGLPYEPHMIAFWGMTNRLCKISIGLWHCAVHGMAPAGQSGPNIERLTHHLYWNHDAPRKSSNRACFLGKRWMQSFPINAQISSNTRVMFRIITIAQWAAGDECAGRGERGGSAGGPGEHHEGAHHHCGSSPPFHHPQRRLHRCGAAGIVQGIVQGNL